MGVVINEEKKADTEPAKRAATPSDDEEDWTVVTDKKDGETAGQEASLSLYPTLTENPPADIPTAPVASHPDPKIQVALQPSGGQEWRHWKSSGHPPACQEINLTH